jgi:VIT1/CCC1 family predicted Fe2+/Mn2+ transporter
MIRAHAEAHKTDRVGWRRAAVLGANDGTISVAGLVVGVAASGATDHAVLIAGVAGTIAGAMSMAAGEYVSVKSQADTERADLEFERRELAANPASELEELTVIYMRRGLERPLARVVAERLTEHDALAAHARDEIGITHTLRARPIQAAIASAAAFSAGAVVPIVTVIATPVEWVGKATFGTALVALLFFGAIAARVGGASVVRGGLRVAASGAIAMALTAVVGNLFGTTF